VQSVDFNHPFQSLNPIFNLPSKIFNSERIHTAYRLRIDAQIEGLQTNVAGDPVPMASAHDLR
jgi:hypothetical protein